VLVLDFKGVFTGTSRKGRGQRPRAPPEKANPIF
jgi:hypothetical protein